MKASCLILSLFATLVPVLSGCSSPCESTCATFNECPLDKRDHDVDCPTFCSREEQFEEAAASQSLDTCNKEFTSYISCWETNSAEICDAANTKCDASLTAWTECMKKFCAVEKNFTDQGCVAQEMGPALPALAGF